MKTLFSVVLICSGLFLFASEHGMYLRTNADIQGNISNISEQITEKLTAAGYEIFFADKIATPDIISEKDKKCGFHTGLIIFSSDEYVNNLTSFGNKYLAAAFLKIGLFENPDGMQILIADPETVNRIIFNDLPEEKYNQIIVYSKNVKEKIIDLLHSLPVGKKVIEIGSPIRSNGALRKGAKDMMMMVGPMTFFKDKNQFKTIFSADNKSGKSGLNRLKSRIEENIRNFEPSENDKKYYQTESPENLKWKIVGEVYAPDSTAVLLGIIRDRTTALSFHIAGMKRETDNNKCPGIDHVCAYPIEVLVSMENGKLSVQTPREMFRMDMYFWDAGKWAFMKFMNLPKMLDKSVIKAILNEE